MPWPLLLCWTLESLFFMKILKLFKKKLSYCWWRIGPNKFGCLSQPILSGKNPIHGFCNTKENSGNGHYWEICFCSVVLIWVIIVDISVLLLSYVFMLQMDLCDNACFHFKNIFIFPIQNASKELGRKWFLILQSTLWLHFSCFTTQDEIGSL